MTFRQNIRHKRNHLKRIYNRSPKMNGCPLKMGICVKVGTTKPKKPNSAVRKIAKVRLLSTGYQVRAVIPGSGFEITEHNTVALRAGRARDIPGVHYRLVRGIADLAPPSGFDRNNRRSKFGQCNYVYLIKDIETQKVTVVATLRSQRHAFEREYDLPLSHGTRTPVIPLPPHIKVTFRRDVLEQQANEARLRKELLRRG